MVTRDGAVMVISRCPTLEVIRANRRFLPGTLDVADGDDTILAGARESGQINAKFARQPPRGRQCRDSAWRSFCRATLGSRSRSVRGRRDLADGDGDRDAGRSSVAARATKRG